MGIQFNGNNSNFNVNNNRLNNNLNANKNAKTTNENKSLLGNINLNNKQIGDTFEFSNKNNPPASEQTHDPKGPMNSGFWRKVTDLAVNLFETAVGAVLPPGINIDLNGDDDPSLFSDTMFSNDAFASQRGDLRKGA